MTLTKAIEILEINLKEAGKQMPPDCKQALRLGIEALKYVRHTREIKVLDPGGRLPGETQE